ncbi:unnamed protein product [Rangifer tarandus platyrhynchus]|uniref:Uncharacterized protein n=2 Tax=Rangifer tarandus platyrhynchus TaxID=3082113 RepID=A0ACB0E7X0_RANTA|nr:unnamed protein product [Rangifer tarandus platyrhynchus]CAI9696511.1 unnamed protein product [Rangifer tarandus platyrhynchus]
MKQSQKSIQQKDGQFPSSLPLKSKLHTGATASNLYTLSESCSIAEGIPSGLLCGRQSLQVPHADSAPAAESSFSRPSQLRSSRTFVPSRRRLQIKGAQNTAMRLFLPVTRPVGSARKASTLLVRPNYPRRAPREPATSSKKLRKIHREPEIPRDFTGLPRPQRAGSGSQEAVEFWPKWRCYLGEVEACIQRSCASALDRR